MRALLLTALGALAVAAVGACGSSSDGSGGASSFDCHSKCPNDPGPFSDGPFCEGTVSGPCSQAFAALEQCMSDHQVCDSDGMTDEEATMAACTAAQNALDDCVSCGPGGCPEAAPPPIDASDGAPPPDGITLASGTSTLVDVFVVDTGIAIIASDSITVVDRTGRVLDSVTLARTVTASAYDGTTLAVADETTLTTYTTSLVPTSSAMLTTSCQYLVMISGGRVVCAPDSAITTWNLSVYGKGAAVETKLAWEMYFPSFFRRIPGTDDIATIDENDGEGLLLRVDPTSSMVVSVGGGARETASSWSTALAFEGMPATHLVTDQGALFEIYPSTCSVSLQPSICFTGDGDLGVLSTGEVYVGLDGDGGTGTIEGLIATLPQPGQGLCGTGCFVERVDLSTRAVLSKKAYPLDGLSVVAARHDAVGGALIVGYTRQGVQTDGYRVALLPYS